MGEQKQRNDGWKGLALAILSGGLLALAYPERHIWPLALVSYIPLLITLSRQEHWKAGLLRGWLTGVVLHLGCYYWVYHTMISMSDLPPVWAAVACLLFGMYSGLQHGLFGALFPWLYKRAGGHAIWMIPVLYTATETIFPHVFPWYLGNVLYSVPELVQTADLAGVHGNSFILVLSSALLMHAFVKSRKWVDLSAARALGLWVLLWAGVMTYGLIRMSLFDAAPAEKELRVGLVQANITPQDKKRKGASRGMIYDKGVEQMKSLEEDELDLIVWPEGGYPYYFPNDIITEESKAKKSVGKGYAGKLQKMVKDRGTSFTFGALTKPSDGGKLRNTFIQLAPDGSFEEVHVKRVLVPFGEYIPFSDWFPFVKGKVKGIGDMAPGEHRVVFDVNGVKILPSICYEAIYPGLTREAVMEDPRAEMILNITNDMWFGNTSALTMHLMVQTSRAVELRVPLVRSTNSGITAFVDATGRLSGETPRYEALATQGVVEVKSTFSLYSHVGDIPLGVVTVMMFILCWFRPVQTREEFVKAASREEKNTPQVNSDSESSM